MESPIETLASRGWKWFVIVGALVSLAGLGAITLPVFAGMAVTTLVGALFLFSGLVQGYHTFRIHQWSVKLWYVFSAIIYILGGLFILFEPLSGLITLTMLMVVIMIFNGVTRVIFGIANRKIDGASWIVFSGILSIILGVYFFSLLGNPEISTSLLGIFIGVSLLMEGISFVFMGFQLRRAASV
ncbi:HdeD family acid-resistance protein [Vibrio sp. SM6]|uniref:HdeD family acid-resistance protein n=1 Tax=Vibrio agarilyticus TaxID=2726741 RepID=A0A7X8YG11_9VIBR|nr:DUF308 domain-containing protein [Vibrio agarilyticus]NLS12100.1 HdeD family acid-resistance protein [Vibrio agarilyticus]